MDFLDRFKDYLSDRPETAFLAISLFVCVYLFRKYDKARDRHIEILETIVPLAENLRKMVRRIQAFNEKWEK
jgi:hypothetical protein